MVFPSIRVYLDPPNLHQEPNQQHQHHYQQPNGSSTDELHAHQLLPPLPPQAQTPQAGTIRAGSMADGAQIAKIPTPAEAALKCPRCESTNTKFCYFNNYSLSQPRHLCKTCRRYWTRGGALRNVPVGGGCRRNNKKSSKRGQSKSPAPTTEKHSSQLLGPNSTSAVAAPSGATCHELIGRFPQPHDNRASLMASLQNMGRFGNIGQNELMGFQIGGGGGVEQWRLQQFPGFDSVNNNNSVVTSATYPFESNQGSTVEGVSTGFVGLGLGDMQMMPPAAAAAVKLEGSGVINLMRSSHQMSSNQYYSWTSHDLSAGLASSATHIL